MFTINMYKKSYKHLVVFTALLFLFSCSGSRKSDSESHSKKITLPSPPEMMTDPTDRAGYVVDHVWSEIDQIDTVNFYSAKQMEQFLVDYFAIGNIATDQKFKSSIKELFQKGTTSLNQAVLLFNEEYISHPNSPIYNLDQYFEVLSIADELGILDEAQKLRYDDKYALFLKNRVGELSQDFTYYTPDGKKHTLHTDVYKDIRLLIFYNPDCHACASTLEYLNNSNTIQNAIKKDILDILCIYADGDEKRWRDTLSKMPRYATVGIDRDSIILHKSLYDLKASPTLYLLDVDKKVLMKDLFPNQLEEYLETNKL